MPRLPWHFDEHCRIFADHPAVVEGDSVISYKQLEMQTAGIAATLGRAGVSSNSVVATIGENTLEHVLLLIGIWRAGAISFPLNQRFPKAHLAKIRDQVPVEYAVIFPDLLSGKIFPHQIQSGKILSPRKAGKTTSAKAVFSASDFWNIILTSGSTGEPAAALHTFGNHYYSAAGSKVNLPVGPGDRWLLGLPLFHIGGLAIVMRCLLAGATVVCPGKKLTPDRDILEMAYITHLSLVPTQLRRLLKDGLGQEFGHDIKAILVGGAHLPEGLVKLAGWLGLPLLRSYGSTEMSSQITTTEVGQARGSGCGKPLAYREVKIDTAGQILVRGKTLFSGYLRSGQLNLTLTEEGWFATGDRGEITRDGHLVVLGRIDNSFISGGENIRPEEIERVLEDLPGILQALVVAVGDQEFGNRPFAFVQWLDDQPIDRQIVVKKLQEVLPKFKIPVAILKFPDEVHEGRFKTSRKIAEKIAANYWSNPDNKLLE